MCENMNTRIRTSRVFFFLDTLSIEIVAKREIDGNVCVRGTRSNPERNTWKNGGMNANHMRSPSTSERDLHGVRVLSITDGVDPSSIGRRVTVTDSRAE
jgi:hypothetical protein